MLFVGLVALVAAAGGRRRSPEVVAWLMLGVALGLTAGLAWALRRHALWPPR